MTYFCATCGRHAKTQERCHELLMVPKSEAGIPKLTDEQCERIMPEGRMDAEESAACLMQKCAICNQPSENFDLTKLCPQCAAGFDRTNGD